MTTKRELEAQLGHKLRDDLEVIDDEVVRVDASGTIVERFEPGRGNGMYIPATTTPILTPTRPNAPGMQSSHEQEIGPPPSAADRFPRDPEAIPPGHSDYVQPRSMRRNPNAVYGNHRVKVVDGIATEYVDEKGPNGGDDGGVRLVG